MGSIPGDHVQNEVRRGVNQEKQSEEGANWFLQKYSLFQWFLAFTSLHGGFLVEY